MKCRCLLFFVFVAMGLAACKNNDEVFAPAVSSFFNVVNASADTLNIYLNGTRQNNRSGLSPGGQSYYLIVPAGQQSYQFKKAGNADVLFSRALTLKDSVNYTIYIAGETVDKTFTTIDSLHTDTVKNTAQVRFVNVSADAGNLDVFVGDTVNFKSRAYKSSSVFLPMRSGQKEVKILQTGTTTLKIDTLITFRAGGIYTLFSRGLVNGAGNKAFKVGVVINY
jgi:hypothetical protein